MEVEKRIAQAKDGEHVEVTEQEMEELNHPGTVSIQREKVDCEEEERCRRLDVIDEMNTRILDAMTPGRTPEEMTAFAELVAKLQVTRRQVQFGVQQQPPTPVKQDVGPVITALNSLESVKARLGKLEALMEVKGPPESDDNGHDMTRLRVLPKLPPLPEA